MRCRRLDAWWIAALALTLVVAGPTARACTPYLPGGILGVDGAVLELPWSFFRDHLPYLEASLPEPSFPFVDPGVRAARLTAAAAAEDLIDALAGSLPEPEIARRVAACQVARLAVLRYREAYDAWRGASSWHRSRHPSPQPPMTAVPAGLPAEFALYLEGAFAYYREETDAAAEAWRRLLALPAVERHYRSTWASYMLGRLEVDRDPAAAAEYFRTTRRLAAEGFADRLGLAHDSLGWEARAAWREGHLGRALELYVQQLVAGDVAVWRSVHDVCSTAVYRGEEVLAEMAGKPLSRELLTFYLASHGEPEVAARWVGLVGPASGPIASAGLMAWTAYRGGRFDEARRWAGLAPEDDPRGRWIEAKLLLRDGDLEIAVPLLRRVSETLPDGGTPWYIDYEDYQNVATGALAGAEAGIVELARGRYTDVLGSLAAAGLWVDAAYLAERALTLEELLTYVRAEAPEPTTGDAQVRWETPQTGLVRPSAAWVAWRLRYLTARRLGRAGRFDEALPFYPEDGLRR